MVKLRPRKIKEVDGGESTGHKISSVYPNKVAKFHRWINMSNLKDNKAAQCGWDDGDCNHTMHYGIGGYHNVCAIAGINGDYPWPALLRCYDFNFEGNEMSKSGTVKSISVSFEHRMVGVAVGERNSNLYDNWGPNFHKNSKDWVTKVYFTNGSDRISSIQENNNNPKLSKSGYSQVSFKFKDVSISELMKSNFALNIQYNHNHNTNPGIIYIKNVIIDVNYEDGDIYIKGKNSSGELYTSKEDGCYTQIVQKVKAGVKNSKGLGKHIVCKSMNKNPDIIIEDITSTDVPDDEKDTTRKFRITDKTGVEKTRAVKYYLDNYKSEQLTLEYTAIKRKRPVYSIATEYKFKEDYVSGKPYIVFKDGCASDIKIFIDSLDSTPLLLPVANNNSSVNLLNEEAIQTFHTAVKNLSCGYHTLYIQRGLEPVEEAFQNKVIIKVSPMNFRFAVYGKDTENNSLEFSQTKTDNASQNRFRYQKVILERIDSEPKSSTNFIVKDETQPDSQRVFENMKKGDKVEYTIDTYYSGDYYLNISGSDNCNGEPFTKKFTVVSTHKQNYDYLFTRGAKRSAFDFDYFVAWEGDNIKEPIKAGDIVLKHSSDDICIISRDSTSSLSQIGTIDLTIYNKTDEMIEGVNLELNPLIKDENGEFEVSPAEWTSPDGIFNQFMSLFYDFNQHLVNDVEVKNLSPDNDLVEEENVYLRIKQIDAESYVKISLPFRSTTEKTAYLQYLLFEQPLIIHSECYDGEEEKDKVEINIIDSVLTDLQITSNIENSPETIDLLNLDESFECPTECYTTKDIDPDTYKPVQDKETGGITYKITNIDTVNLNGLKRTVIINDPELVPYGYIDKEEVYHDLIDNNGDIIEDPTSKLQLIRKESIVSKIMAGQNIRCDVTFPNSEKVSYTIKTDRNGVANFYIPIPNSQNERYTVDELLEGIITFVFEEQKEYNEGVLTTNPNYPYKPTNNDKSIVSLKTPKNFKKYFAGGIVFIPITLVAYIKIPENYLIFDAELGDNGSFDYVTVLYQICNLPDNKGIFKTTFKTNDIKLLPNEVSKKIYCGILSDTKVYAKINSKIVEKNNINIVSLAVKNTEKENKDVEIEVNLGKLPEKNLLGKYDFLEINMDDGDYAITKDDEDNTYVSWLIGFMKEFEEKNATIKIKAVDVGLSDITINSYDYLNPKGQEGPKKAESPCVKCEEGSNTWGLSDSKWKQFNGVWYKFFGKDDNDEDIYKRPVFKKEDGEYKRVWEDKE